MQGKARSSLRATHSATARSEQRCERAVCVAYPAPLPPTSAPLRPPRDRRSRPFPYLSEAQATGLTGLGEPTEPRLSAGVASTGSVPPASEASVRGEGTHRRKAMGRGARSPFRACNPNSGSPLRACNPSSFFSPSMQFKLRSLSPSTQGKGRSEQRCERAVCVAYPAPLPPTFAALRPPRDRRSRPFPYLSEAQATGLSGLGEPTEPSPIRAAGRPDPRPIGPVVSVRSSLCNWSGWRDTSVVGKA